MARLVAFSDMSFDEHDLALRSGTNVERLRRMVELGIVPPPSEDGSFRPKDVLRVRLGLALEGSGISLEDLGRGIAEGAVSFGFTDLALAEPVGLMGRSYAEYAKELGLSHPFVERVRSALGVLDPHMDDPARDDDAEILRIAAAALALGITEESAIRTARVFSENIRRIVDLELELVRGDIENPMLMSGLTEQQVLDRMALARSQLEPFTARILELLHRQYEERAFFQDVIERLEAALEKAGVAQPKRVHPPAIAFLDLTGYTHLTEEVGDALAAELSGRLADLVQETAQRHGGWPVKLLGDGVMFHFPDPLGGVRCALELVERTPQAGLPRSRVGLTSGPVVVRDGDYFGRTVNVAARIADYARPGEVLVTDDVVLVGRVDGVAFREIGEVELKGVAEPVRLHRAVRAS